MENSASRIKVFEGLDDDVVQRLSAQCRWQRLRANSLVVEQSDDTTDLFLIAEGRVRAKKFSLAGKEVSFIDLSSGDVFGEFSAIDGQPRSATVVTLTDCVVGRLSADAFMRLLSEHPEVSLKVIEMLVAKVRELSERVFEFSALAVRNRIHAELLRLAHTAKPGAEENSAVIDEVPTHYEIATRISTHREAVTRELNTLEANGVIRAERGRIVVRDMKALRSMVDQLIEIEGGFT